MGAALSSCLDDTASPADSTQYSVVSSPYSVVSSQYSVFICRASPIYLSGRCRASSGPCMTINNYTRGWRVGASFPTSTISRAPSPTMSGSVSRRSFAGLLFRFLRISQKGQAEAGPVDRSYSSFESPPVAPRRSRRSFNLLRTSASSIPEQSERLSIRFDRSEGCSGASNDTTRDRNDAITTAC